MDDIKIFMDAVNQVLQAHNNALDTLRSQHNNLVEYIQGFPELQKSQLHYINKRQLDYEMEIQKELSDVIHPKDPETKLIISLTSFPQRMYDIKYTLYSLVKQSLRADEILLWLAEEEFPNHESDLAPSLLNLIHKWNITIKWCDKNYKSFKKIIPALREYPEAIIVTADDDLFYPENWLEILYNDYKENGCICAHRAHKIAFSEGKILPYRNWDEAINGTESYLNFLTSGSGVLFYPHCFHKDITDEDKFLSLCPTADDIWIWAMAVMNHSKIRIPSAAISTLTYINPERELRINGEFTLGSLNIGQNQNDTQINNIFHAYPEIMNLLQSECCNNKTDDQAINNCSFSASYWENRYRNGMTSGAGSYNRLAEFKAGILNDFVVQNNVKTIIEWGCGDGNQLSLAKYPEYVGFDVSQQAVKICTEKFRGDSSKRFFCCGTEDFSTDLKAELSLSLDVLYHLVEDDIFELYMKRLFESSLKYVCIYSCNFDKFHAPHVRYRKFTKYIEEKFTDWKLIKFIENEYPYDEADPSNTSWSDFYIYERMD